MNKSFLLAVLLSTGCALSAMADFVDVTKPASIYVDAHEGVDRVSVLPDGRVTIRSTEPISRVTLVWPASFGPNGKAFGGDFERTYGDSGWYPIATGETARPRHGAMAWYTLVTEAGRTDGYGVAVQPNVFAAWHVTPTEIRLELDCRAGSQPVELNGRTLEACRLVSRKGAEGESAFAAGRAFCRMMCPSPRLPPTPVYGYNDWYCAYGNNTATNFLADAAFVLSLVEGESNRPYIVVDDGWQRGRQGDPMAAAAVRWRSVNPRWGMPMDEVARRVKALGGRPGLWYRPFLPDDEQRIPMDPTDPDLAARIRADLRGFADWGMELVKIDFITYEWAAKWGMNYGDSPVARDLPVWRDRSRTTAEVVKGLYQTMRAAAGERMVIIGCNALDHFAAGLFELQRTGDDTSGREWARTRKMGPNTLGMRALHHGIFYAVDGDCFGLAAEGLVPWELNVQWLDLIARSGTALFVSWKRQLTTPQAKAALESALRRAAKIQPTGEPLDWTETLRPTTWRFGAETRTYDWK